MIVCRNRETGEITIFSNIKAVLKEINRNRSAEWSPYNKHDWEEGLNEFTEYEIVLK